MRQLGPRAIVAAVALAVVPALIASSLLVLAHPWANDAAYALPGFPKPRIVLGDDERSRLAAVGTRAVQPWHSDGIAAMRAARRDNGSVAFERDELDHFADVRTVVLAFLIAGAAGLAVIALAAALARDRALVRRGLALGTRLTIVIFAATAVLMLIDFDAFLERFHRLFFAAGSWKLPTYGTVRSLYPDALWGLMGGAMVVLVLGQVAAITVALRRSGR